MCNYHKDHTYLWISQNKAEQDGCWVLLRNAFIKKKSLHSCYRSDKDADKLIISSFTLLKSSLPWEAVLATAKIRSLCDIQMLPLTDEGFASGSVVNNLPANAGDMGSIPGLGRFPGEEKGYPLQYSGLENSMDYKVHGVTKSRTRLGDFHFHFCSMWWDIKSYSALVSRWN